MLQKKGRFPADVRRELDRERIVLLAEGIPGKLTHRDEDGRKRAGSGGTITGVAITQQRLAIYGLGRPLVDVTWDSGDARELDITADDTGLSVAFDAQRFGHERPGRIELFLRIADAAALLAAIDQRRRPLERRQRFERQG